MFTTIDNGPKKNQKKEELDEAVNIGFLKTVQNRTEIKQNQKKIEEIKKHVEIKEPTFNESELYLANLLYLSCKNKVLKEIKELIENDVYPNFTPHDKISNKTHPNRTIHTLFFDKDGETAHNQYDFIVNALEILIKGGKKYKTNLNSKETLELRTPLFIACQTLNFKAIKLLIEAGADTNLADFRGDTCLHVMTKHHERSEEDLKDTIFEIICLLLSHGADPRLLNSKSISIMENLKNVPLLIKLQEYNSYFEEKTEGGFIEATLSWNSRNDLDISCICPCGSEIYYGEKKCKKNTCSCYLDIDMNIHLETSSKTPIEHIRFEKPLKGKYIFTAKFFKNHKDIEVKTPFLFTLKKNGEYICGKLCEFKTVEDTAHIYLEMFGDGGHTIEFEEKKFEEKIKSGKNNSIF